MLSLGCGVLEFFYLFSFDLVWFWTKENSVERNEL